jgi:hypothetical protein
MFRFGNATAPDFLPADDSREWIASRLRELSGLLGAPAQTPQLIIDPPGGVPGDLDGFFEMVCNLQELVGQQDLEFTLLEANQTSSELPEDYAALGDPSGQLLHTARGRGEYVLLFAPTLFRKRELLFASLAREIGRMAIHEAGGHGDLERKDWEADAELAGISLGLGIWVANGAYMFENACCGGGCGVDLKGLRAGLSMPEACYATALDAQRKGMSRRSVARHLEPTQKAALKASWKDIGQNQPLAALTAPTARAELA